MCNRLIVCVVILLLPVANLAQEKKTDKQLKHELKTLSADVAVLMLLYELNLTKEQVKKLVPIVEEARTCFYLFQKSMQRIIEEQRKAFARFRQEDLKNQGFTPEIEERTARADHRGEMVSGNFMRQIEMLSQEVAEILSDGQKEFLNETLPPYPPDMYNPVCPPIFVFEKVFEQKRKSQETEKKRPDPLKFFIIALRKLSDEEFEEQKDSIIEMVLERAPPFITRDRERILKALIKIRKLKDEELWQKVPEIIESLIEEDEGTKLKKELEKERRRIVERRMGEFRGVVWFLMYPNLYEILAKKLNKKTTQCRHYKLIDLEDMARDVHKLRREINVLNLVNGLNLSSHQIAHILSACKKLKKFEGQTKFQPDAAKKLIKLLTKTKELLLEEKELPIALYSKIFTLHEKLYIKNIKEGHEETVAILIDEIKGVLFDTQKEVILTYSPCLIPPKHLKDPVRVGQAEDTDAPVKLLRELRNIPEEIYHQRKQILLNELIEHAENEAGGFPDKERHRLRKKLEEMLDKIRALSDVDFELNKSDLARKLTELLKGKIHRIESKLKKLYDREDIIAGKIRENLLDTENIPVLQERLKIMKKFEAGKPVDLDKISPAENCKKGKCAIDD